MKQNNAKKTLIKAYSIVVLMVLSTLAWTMTNGAGHGVTITKPENNSTYNNLYNKARVTTEKTAITFDFTIDNHDGYLIKYDAWIDGVADTKLNDPNWTPSLALAHYVISYDAQQFLDNYGQGSHTFTVAIYHGTPYVRPPFGLQEGDNPDDDDIYWVGNQGYLLSLVDEVSVTFTFDPVVVHYLGFWLIETGGYSHKCDILPYKDLLWSSDAHYLHGYSYATGFWDCNTPGDIMKNYLSPKEDSNDIDVLLFSSHGKKSDIYGLECTNKTSSNFKWLTRNQLRDEIDNANLDSSTILLIIDCCYSEMFLDAFQDTNVVILASCRIDESGWGIESAYNPTWSLKTKIDKIDGDFVRALAIGIYYGYSLTEAWSRLGYSDCDMAFDSYSSHRHIANGDQHPVHTSFPSEEIILYVYNL